MAYTGMSAIPSLSLASTRLRCFRNAAALMVINLRAKKASQRRAPLQYSHCFSPNCSSLRAPDLLKKKSTKYKDGFCNAHESVRAVSRAKDQVRRRYHRPPLQRLCKSELRGEMPSSDAKTTEKVSVST